MKINKVSVDIVIQTLEKRGKLTVNDVTGLLSISPATARRLFIQLNETGQAIRTFGGIQKIPTDNDAYSFNTSETLRASEKTAIGNLAALEVNSNDQIFLDSGTTVLAMAKALARRHENKEISNVRILTNSLILADILTPYCKVVLIGGEIRRERRDACGFIAEEILKRLHVKKAFLGCDALDFDSGFMTTDERTARMNEIIIKNANSVLILADATKIGASSFVSYGGLDCADTFITDSDCTPEQREAIASGIGKILIACP